jgi:hypothetical protein
MDISDLVKYIWTITQGIWKILSENALIGATMGSIISGILIHWWSQFQKRKNIIEALKKELETNKALLDYGIKESLKSGKVAFIYFHFDSFIQMKNNNLIKIIGIERYNELISIYNQLHLIDRMLHAIELGLRDSKKPEEFIEGWKKLSFLIETTNKKIK